MRRLFPYLSAGRWSGATLSAPTSRHEDVQGGCFCVQWLGFMIEIGAGRVKRTRP